MKKVKYAIVGFGGIAENRIAREGFGLDKDRFKGHRDAELTGAMDINPERVKAVRNLGIKWFSDIDDLLKSPDVEAVFIATNNLSHAPIAKRVLLAGKHCVLEKPMATRLRDAEEVVGLARKKRLSLSVDHMMMENVYNIRAKKLIAMGKLGKVNDIRLHIEFLYGSTPGEAGAWRCADPLEIGGPIGDVASHCLYMAEFLLDSEIEYLSCVYTPRTLSIKVENGAFIQFTLKNGMSGTVQVAFNQPRGGMKSTLTDLGYEVFGTEATLRGYATLFQLSGHTGEPVNVRLELDSFQRTETVRIQAVRNIYQAVIARHAQSIMKDSPMDGGDAFHNLDLILKSHESAKKNGKRIKIS